MRQALERFINHRFTDLVVVSLILSSVILLVVEDFLPESSSAFEAIEIAGHTLTWIFVVELFIRFLCMSGRRFLRSYWLDIIAVLPVTRSLRILRVLRLLRLFRVGVLLNRRLIGLSDAFRSGKSEILAVGVVVAIVVLVGAIGINIAEGRQSQAFGDLGESTWWSLYTLVSGNPVSEIPRTFLGRMLGLLVIVGGVGFFATITGVVSAGMVNRLSKKLEVGEMMLDDLRDHVVICGWNRIGLKILADFKYHREFSKRAVVLISELAQAPVFPAGLVDPERFIFISGDFTKVEVLQRARVERASTAILLADKALPRSDQDRDARTVLAALTIEKLNKNIYSCVELLNRDNEAHLSMAGVEEIIVPDEYAGSVMAAATRTRGIVSMLDELLSSPEGNNILKAPLPAEWAGREVRWVHQTMKEEYNCVLVSVERCDQDGRSIRVNPPPGEKLLQGDNLIFIAEKVPEKLAGATEGLRS